jgi:hypothetical protein
MLLVIHFENCYDVICTAEYYTLGYIKQYLCCLLCMDMKPSILLWMKNTDYK